MTGSTVDIAGQESCRRYQVRRRNPGTGRCDRAHLRSCRFRARPKKRHIHHREPEQRPDEFADLQGMC